MTTDRTLLLTKPLTDEQRQQAIAILADWRDLAPLYKFRDTDTGQVLTLEEFWPGQETLAAEFEEFMRVAVGKARKLGITVLEVLWGLHVILTQPNSRWHVISATEQAMMDFIRRVEFAIMSLPEWLRPPILRTTSRSIEIGEGHDVRTVQGYVASLGGAGMDMTATHTTADEWSKTVDPMGTFQSIEPSIAKGSGTAHLIFVSRGAGHSTSTFFTKTLNGEIPDWRASFLPWTADSARVPNFREQKERSLGRDRAKREYPATVEEFISSGSDQRFKDTDLVICREDTTGPLGREDGCKYAAGWDIGQKHDPTVCVVLRIDRGEQVVDVVHGEALQSADAPVQKAKIESIHKRYGAFTAVEDNNAGWAIRQSLDLPEREVGGWTTSGVSKPRMLENLSILVESGLIRWDPNEWPELDREMAIYSDDDQGIPQDWVMALGIAAMHIPSALRRGGRGKGRVGTWPGAGYRRLRRSFGEREMAKGFIGALGNLSGL